MRLGDFIIRRTIYMAITLFAVITINFCIFNLMPADPVSTMLDPNLPYEAQQLLRKEFGLDEPLYIRYVIYVKNLLSGELGVSFWSKRPVIDEILERLPNTILLTGAASITTICFGIILGIFASSKRGSKIDVAVIVSGLFAYGVPTFFIGLLMLLFFAYLIPIFPIAGTMSRPPPMGLLAYIIDVLKHLALPLLTITIAGFGGWALYVRNLLLDTLTEDYILTARAKGLSEKTILFKHGFRNILPPMITIMSLSLPGIFTGSLITEVIFSWHGVGRFLFEAIMRVDYPVMQGCFYIIAILVLLSNFLADILYNLVDPRIRR